MKLRKLQDKDSALMKEWMLNNNITKYFRFDANSASDDKIKNFIQNSFSKNYRHYAIVDENDEYLGTVSLKNINRIPNTAEFAIVLREGAAGKGYGKRAVREILTIAFDELNLKKIYLNVLKNNEKAIKLYEKIGFRTEDEYQLFMTEDDKDIDLFYYSITKRDMIEKSFELLMFNQKGDDRGHLVIIEGNEDIPFEIKRAFYIFGSDKDVIRGCHANRRTEFVLINVSGKSKVKIDNGISQKIVELNQPHMGVYIPRMIWKEMYEFSEDSILLVLASEHYDKNEYISDYEAYVSEMKEFF
ncbi:MAG: GNAT family N-acetyltransferase [Erysipelotrichales bacterium]|nr:GNAT family N-acetyltransferase [Erysipelotrichales bacterium]